MSDNPNFPKPTFITGGCLCGALRYRVEFPEDHDFLKSVSLSILQLTLASMSDDGKKSGTCQCTMDRKCTSALWFQYHRIRAESAFRFTSQTTLLKHYESSPGSQRGFCGECGSFLYIKPAAAGHELVTIAVGTVDALYLIGEGADGKDVPKGGFGFALVNGGRPLSDLPLHLLGFQHVVLWES